MELLTTLLLLLPSIFTLTILVPLFTNFLKAGKTGFPRLTVPIDPHNPLWMVVGRATAHLRHVLPRFVWLRLRYTLHGWEFMDQMRDIRSPSRAFMLVNPGINQLWVEESEMAEQIMARRHDFLQAEMTKTLIGIFGPSTMDNRWA